jgi:hypothetical protein
MFLNKSAQKFKNKLEGYDISIRYCVGKELITNNMSAVGVVLKFRVN